MEIDDWNQSKTQKGNFGMLAGHQSVGNLIIFALLKDRTEGKVLVVHEQTNLVLRSLLMIGMNAFELRHHIAELKVMLRRELRVWPSGLCLEDNRIIHTRNVPGYC